MTQPKRVTILQIGVFVCGLWNLGRVIQLVQPKTVLSQFEATLNPTLRLFLALFWLIVFGLWFGWRGWNGRYRLALPLTFLLYGLSELALTWFQTNASGWLLEAIFYSTLTIYSYWVISKKNTT